MRARCLLSLILAGCAAQNGAAITTGADAAVDAPVTVVADAKVCTPGCHWDCFGGSECVAGFAWFNAFAPRECCTSSDPWPDPGPTCSVAGIPCAGGQCAVPDPRYATCLALLGTPAEPCFDADCEQLRLHCPQGAVKRAGAPCAGDRDCRPAAEDTARLVCDTGAGSCVAAARPDPPANYGASCGLTVDEVTWLIGEAVVRGATCALCQVEHASEGACLRQGCTIGCTFDEDCPSGSVCLCGATGSPVIGYCARATDRDTPAGRAAGLPSCP